MRGILILALIGVVVLVWTGGEEVPEADLVFASSSPHHTLDPQKMSWGHDLRVIAQLYDPLVDYNFKTGEPEPATAHAWERSEDRRTYTFHLREDAKWSNGDPVTAHDYIFAWRRALLPSNAAPYTSLLYRIEGAKAFYQWRRDQLETFQKIADQAADSDRASGLDAARATWQTAQDRFAKTVGLEAPNDHTLKVTLERPVPYFLQLVSFGTFSPVHPPSVKKATRLSPESGGFRTDEQYWGDPDRLVTNGPYRVAEYKASRYMHLKANEHYYAHDQMQNKSVLERIIQDANHQVLAYHEGEVDWLLDLPAQSSVVLDLVKQERNDVHQTPMAATYFFNYNCDPDYTLSNGDPNPLANAKVRRALSMGIDRQTIVNRVLQLGQPVARSYVPPGAIAGYDPPVEAGVTFNPQRGRELLAEAGYPGGDGLDGLSIMYNTKGEHKKIAEKVQSMWRRHLGVQVGLKGLNSSTFGERMDNGKYSICRAGWIGDYPDPTTWLTKLASDSANNDANWSNASFDALLNQAADQHGRQRMQTLRQAERLLLQEQPMALLYFYLNVDIFDPERLKGVTMSVWPRWKMEAVRVVEPAER